MQLVRVRSSIWSALLVASMLMLGAGSALAQDATPTPAVESPHPVHIHSGTCDALGEVVYPLTDTAPYEISRAFTFGPSATPEAESEATPLPGVSVTQSVPVQFSVTHLDVEVVDLVAGGFAVNAHESAENISNYIACGNIPPCTAAACAAVTGVVIDLVPLNDSGYFGVAQIDTDPEGGSIVTIFIFHPETATSG